MNRGSRLRVNVTPKGHGVRDSGAAIVRTEASSNRHCGGLQIIIGDYRMRIVTASLNGGVIISLTLAPGLTSSQ